MKTYKPKRFAGTAALIGLAGTGINYLIQRKLLADQEDQAILDRRKEIGAGIAKENKMLDNYYANHPELVYGTTKNIQAFGKKGTIGLANDVQLVNAGTHESGNDLERSSDFVEGGEVLAGGAVHSNRINAFSPAQFSASLGIILDEIDKVSKKASGPLKGDLSRLSAKVSRRIDEVTDAQEDIKGDYGFGLDKDTGMSNDISSVMGNQNKEINALGAEKAKKMLKDNSAHGRPLTDRQKRYFGWIAGGGKSSKALGDPPTSGKGLFRNYIDNETILNNLDFSQASPEDLYAIQYGTHLGYNRGLPKKVAYVSAMARQFLRDNPRYTKEDWVKYMRDNKIEPEMNVVGVPGVTSAQEKNPEKIIDLSNRRSRLPAFVLPYLNSSMFVDNAEKQRNKRMKEAGIDAVTGATLPLYPVGGKLNKALGDKEENKPTFMEKYGGYVDLGLDLGANVIDNIANASLLKKTPKVPQPKYYSAFPLQTEIDVTNQLSEITDEQAALNNLVDLSTLSSNTALQRKRAASSEAVKARNRVYAEKNAIESDLTNRDILNRQQIENVNADLKSNYDLAKYDRTNQILSAKSANISNLSRDLTDILNKNRLTRFQSEQLKNDMLKYEDTGTFASAALNGSYDSESKAMKKTILDIMKNSGRQADYDALAKRWGLQ